MSRNNKIKCDCKIKLLSFHVFLKSRRKKIYQFKFYEYNSFTGQKYDTVRQKQKQYQRMLEMSFIIEGGRGQIYSKL